MSEGLLAIKVRHIGILKETVLELQDELARAEKHHKRMMELAGGDLAAAEYSPTWTACRDGLPNDCNWYLIALDNSELGVPDEVAMGWRKQDYEDHFSDWWETNRGLCHESKVTHWRRVPALPND